MKVCQFPIKWAKMVDSCPLMVGKISGLGPEGYTLSHSALVKQPFSYNGLVMSFSLFSQFRINFNFFSTSMLSSSNLKIGKDLNTRTAYQTWIYRRIVSRTKLHQHFCNFVWQMKISEVLLPTSTVKRGI